MHPHDCVVLRTYFHPYSLTQYIYNTCIHTRYDPRLNPPEIRHEPSHCLHTYIYVIHTYVLTYMHTYIHTWANRLGRHVYIKNGSTFPNPPLQTRQRIRNEGRRRIPAYTDRCAKNKKIIIKFYDTHKLTATRTSQKR